MNFDLSANELPALKPLLLEALKAAIHRQKTTAVTVTSRVSDALLEPIPLLRAKDAPGILYICAIGLKLAKTWHRPALDIATELAADLSETAKGDAGGLAFTVQVISPGWIHLQLSDRGLAGWLQCLSEGLTGWQDKSSNFDASNLRFDCSSRLFTVQYAHARCCSLLRLAHRDGSIVLSDPNPKISSPVWQLLAPNPIPWLNSRVTPSSPLLGGLSLQLVHPAERALIAQLADTLDALTQPASQKNTDWLKLAIGLSAAFENFYCACRIWGEVKIETPQLAQARLGLIKATHSVLRLMLQDLFGVCAPVEL